MLRSDVRVTARGRTRLHCRRAMSVCAFLVLVMTLTLPLSVLGQTTRKARAEKAACRKGDAADAPVKPLGRCVLLSQWAGLASGTD